MICITLQIGILGGRIAGRLNRHRVEGCVEVTLPTLRANGGRILVKVWQQYDLFEDSRMPGSTNFVVIEVPEEPARAVQCVADEYAPVSSCVQFVTDVLALIDVYIGR